MKYRLKKDLPFADAGTEVWIDNTWTAWIDANVYAPNYGVTEFETRKVMLGKSSTLVAEGWIEEVKPREYWVAYNEDKILGVCKYDNETFVGTTHFVKVREVLE
jgi:hypothetical protein